MIKRVSHSRVQSFREIYDHFEEDCLINGTADHRFQQLWELASPEVFSPPARPAVR
jgi:hypothetical protein